MLLSQIKSMFILKILCSPILEREQERERESLILVDGRDLEDHLSLNNDL